MKFIYIVYITFHKNNCIVFLSRPVRTRSCIDCLGCKDILLFSWFLCIMLSIQNSLFECNRWCNHSHWGQNIKDTCLAAHGPPGCNLLAWYIQTSSLKERFLFLCSNRDWYHSLLCLSVYCTCQPTPPPITQSWTKK